MKIDKILNKIKEKQAEVTGSLGVSFYDLKVGEGCSLNGDKAYPSASVFKLFVLAELFRQIKNGKFSLNQRMILDEKYISVGSGVLRELNPGMNLTVKDYATLMMIISDNSSADFLFHLVGPENIKKNVLEPLNLCKTRCDLDCNDLIGVSYDIKPGVKLKNEDMSSKDRRLHPAFTGELPENDETSPLDTTRMLKFIYENKWLGEEWDSEMVSILKKCQTNQRIPKYLPEEVRVGHKTGTLDKVVNDVGIVYTPKGAYILCMFYNGNLATQEEYDSNENGRFGEEILAHLSKEIYDLYMQYSN